MSTDYSNISWLGVEVVERDILLDSQLKDVFLRVKCCTSIFSNVPCFYHMLNDLKIRCRHGDLWRKVINVSSALFVL